MLRTWWELLRLELRFLETVCERCLRVVCDWLGREGVSQRLFFRTRDMTAAQS